MKIQNKLFIFLFGFSLTLVTILVVLMQWSIGKGMVEYVASKEVETLQPVIAELSYLYQIDNNWDSMQGNHRQFRQLISQALNEGSDNFPSRTPQKNSWGPRDKRKNENLQGYDRSLQQTRSLPRDPSLGRRPPNQRQGDPPPPSFERESNYALLSVDGKVIVGNYPDTFDYIKTPIKIDGELIGYFAVSKRNKLTQGYEVDFIEQQQHYLWLIALGVMVSVALVTLPIARHIVEPIKQITRGMRKLTQGEYKQSIKLNRQDEVYELSRYYNELALTLSENETARKRWLADISHELRTPVAILRGELEAMLDQVRPLTSNNISSANDEVKHLQRLIDDLNILTSTDVGGMSYRKQHEDLISLMKNEQEKYAGYLANDGISLLLNFSVETAHIYVDKSRLVQLYDNIINNCIKYSGASKLLVSVNVESEVVHSNKKTESFVSITFEDDGVGVSNEHLPYLFEHLYRVEDSRNRKTGGSGIGLSICRHIIVAHQGNISAYKSSLGGLGIKISLPLSQFPTLN